MASGEPCGVVQPAGAYRYGQQFGQIDVHLFAALAEFERDLIVERTLAGRTAARARGRLGGRKAKLNHRQAAQLKAMHRDVSFSIGEICETFGISRRTFYRYLNDA